MWAGTTSINNLSKKGQRFVFTILGIAAIAGLIFVLILVL